MRTHVPLPLSHRFQKVVRKASAPQERFAGNPTGKILDDELKREPKLAKKAGLEQDSSAIEHCTHFDIEVFEVFGVFEVFEVFGFFGVLGFLGFLGF